MGTDKDRKPPIEKQVERQLSEAGFKFRSQPIVGQAHPDFLVKTPRGRNIVLEVKKWSDTSANIARAAHQVKRYKNLTKAAGAVIVMEGLSRAIIPSGILPLDGLVDALKIVAEIVDKKVVRKKKILVATSPKRKIFTAMPFNLKYDDTFLVGLQPAAIKVGAVCERVDHDGHYGDVVTQIKDMISSSSAVIADLSESRPNVCYEIGLAEAMKRPVIQICSTSLKLLPFDLRNNATIEYSIGQTTKLQKRLTIELRKIF